MLLFFFLADSATDFLLLLNTALGTLSLLLLSQSFLFGFVLLLCQFVSLAALFDLPLPCCLFLLFAALGLFDLRQLLFFPSLLLGCQTLGDLLRGAVVTLCDFLEFCLVLFLFTLLALAFSTLFLCLEVGQQIVSLLATLIVRLLKALKELNRLLVLLGDADGQRRVAF